MQSVTLEHPSEETSELLHRCDREGSVCIVAAGKHYLLRATPPSRGPIEELPDFRGRRRAAFPKPLTVAQTQAADRWLAGE